MCLLPNAEKVRDTFCGGWVAAVPFVFLGAPMKWQLLALAMGALIAFVYSRSPAPTTED